MKGHLQHHFGAIYHLMTRGNNRQNIFSDTEDRAQYLSLLEQSIERFQCQIHAFCLMSNHTHVLLQVASEPVDIVMHNINSRYANWFNKRHSKVGHLFQGRYKAQSVSSGDYLVRLLRYIHLNPVKAGIVQNPAEYYWSSHHTYTGNQLYNWVSTDFGLLHFDSNRTAALNKYNTYMHENTEGNSDDDLLAEIDALNFEIEKQLVRTPEDLSRDTRILNASFESIVDFICHYYQLDIHLLKGPTSTDIYTHCRAAIACLAKHFKVANICSVAHFFGKNTNSFGKLKNKFEKLNAEQLSKLKKQYLEYIDNL